MQRWVGLGVIAAKLVNIGQTLQKQSPLAPADQYCSHSPPGRAGGLPALTPLTDRLRSSIFAPESS
jgi:hypothetical protein